MSTDAGNKVRLQALNYKNAIKFLDECGEFTYDKFVKVNSIAGSPMRENEIKMMWEMSSKSIATKVGDKYLTGTQKLQLTMRKKFEEAIAAFGPIANEFDTIQAKNKKWWEFW